MHTTWQRGKANTKKNVLLSIDIECPIITGVQESITGVFIQLHHTNDKIGFQNYSL